MAITQIEVSQYSHWKPEGTQIVEGRPVRFRDVCVHEFLLGDVEDPDIYAAEPILQWQNSDQGKWIMTNSQKQPYWIQHVDANTMGYRYKIMARLSEQNETFWRLRWGGRNK
jgi:hypothetical protein